MAALEQRIVSEFERRLFDRHPTGGYGIGDPQAAHQREQKPGDYTDPGWYKSPPGTVAFEWTGPLAEPARFSSESGQSMPLKVKPTATTEVQVRKPIDHKGH